MQRTYVRPDPQLDAAILRLVLIAHPRLLSVSQIAAALRRASDLCRPSVEPGLDRLARAGLIRVEQGLVVPSAAALYFDRLAVD